MTPDGRPPLRVLVVEDETVIAMDLEMILQRAGCEVVATAQRLDQALQAAAEQAIDVALLDVNLGGKQVFPVADVLESRGLPFVFLTGYGGDLLPERFRHCAVLRKPYAGRELAPLLERVARN